MNASRASGNTQRSAVATALTKIPLPPRSFPCAGAHEQAAFWREVNGCRGLGTPVVEGDATCIRWNDCTEGEPVSLCTIDGGGHTWPGCDLGCDPRRRGCQVYAEVVGPTSDDLDANDAIVAHFGGS